MPELPEVETIRRDLETNLLNRRFIAIDLITVKTAKNEADFFIKSLLNKRLENINRYGKLLAFKLANTKNYLLIHLKMTGQLILVGTKKKLAGGHSLNSDSFEKAVGGSLPNKHTRATFKFNGGYNLFFNDLRKFGYLKIVDEKALEKIIKNNYGPEPNSQQLTDSYLKSILANRKSNIKSLLLNQKLIAGLGNIYVDEALFATGIKPTRLGSRITLAEVKVLIKEINKIITKAIKNRGTTFNNYLDSAGKKGNFFQLLKVYGRGGKPCFKCQQPLVKQKIAGRGTHFCKFCQK